MRRRRAIATALILCCTAAVAQEGTLLERFYHRASVDTSYVVRPTTRWTLKGRFLLSHNNLTTNGLHNGATIATGINGGYSPKASLSASYLGLTVNASVNPAKLLGRESDYALGLRCYGRRVGAEFSAQVNQQPEVWFRRGDDEEVSLALSGSMQVHMVMNAYYIFNARRFSYPAAFTQSYIQRRSCGSLLAGATIEGLYLTLGDSTIGEPHYNYSYIKLGLGLGYGYNYVPADGWLLHLSALPSLIINSRQRYVDNGTDQELTSRRAEFAIVGRGAVVYSFGRTFVGLNHVFNFTNTNARGEMGIISTRWQLTAFVGVRL